MNTLKLEKRGCEFSPYDETVKGSDIGNYRVCTPFYDIPAKNGRQYFLEIFHYDKYITRYTNKRTGKPLSRPVKELAALNVCAVNACFRDENGICYGDTSIWRENHETPRPYTEQGILDIVNSFSVNHYDAIEYVS